MINEDENESIAQSPINLQGNMLIICLYCFQGLPFLTMEDNAKEYTLIIKCKCSSYETKSMKLNQYLSIINHFKPQNCTIHNRLGIKYCVDCFTWICQECFITHNKNTYCHLLLDAQMNIACSKHKQSFTHYCKKCQMNVCKKCMVDHSNHKLDELKEQNIEALINYKKQDEEKLEDINKMITQLQNKLQEMQRQREYIFKAINNRNELDCLLDSIKTTVLKCQRHYTYEMMELCGLFQTNKSPKTEYNHVKTIETYSNDVEIMKLLRNGLLASCSRDHIIKLWNLETYQCITVLYGHTDIVQDLKELSDDQIATISYDKTIILWNSVNWKCNKVLKFDYNIDLFLELTDGQIALCLEHDWNIKKIRLFDTINEKYTKILEVNSYSINYISELKNGLLASCSYDYKIRLWSIIKGECIQILYGHTLKINRIIQLNNCQLASCSDDKTVRIWKNPNGIENSYSISIQLMKLLTQSTSLCQIVLKGHNDDVWCLLQLSDDQLLSCSNQKLILWDVKSGYCNKILQGFTETNNYVLVMSDGH